MTDNLLADQTPTEPKDFFAELVGEGKKFKDQQELAKGKYFADQTVEVLQRENEELRQSYKQARDENISKAKLEDLIDQFSNQKLPTSNNNPEASVVNQPTIDAKQIESLVSNKVQEIERSRKENENYNQVVSRLQERFGEKYKDVLKQQTDQIGLTSEEITALAKRSPAAFYRTFGLDQQQHEGFQAPPRSSQRNDNFAPTGAPKRTWMYYQELRKKDPDFIFNKQLQVQMLKDAVELGPAFRDGDYYVKNLHEE